MGESSLLMNSPIIDASHEFPALDLLPPGTVLKMVSLPRFINQKLNSLITYPYMKVESRTEVSGRNVMSYLFDDNQKLTTRFYMQDASYLFDRKLLISKKTTILKDYRIDAIGTGMTFDPERKVGFMQGPGEMIIHKKQ